MEALALGGVWADWQARLEAAESRALAAEQGEYVARLQYEEAQAELVEVRDAHHTLAHSLTSMSLQEKSHLEILEIIKTEKLNLERRTAGLEAGREYQEAQVLTLKERVVALEEEIKSWIDRVDKQMEESDGQKKVIAEQQQKLKQGEKREEALQQRVHQLSSQVETLTHSVDTKSRQLQVLCKERDRLKVDLAASLKVGAAPYVPRPARAAAPNSGTPVAVAPATPCKQRASPISVTASLSPAPKTPGSPAADPYEWLLPSGATDPVSPCANAPPTPPTGGRDLRLLLSKIARA